MITFKKMWDDVLLLLTKKEYKDIDILEKFNSGFSIKDRNDITFISKDDFSNVWCKLLYYDEFSLKQVIGDDLLKPKYIYTILKQLPYISESSTAIKLIQ